MKISIGQIAHSRGRFPAWLGICAILMLFIAPVVSKALVAQGVPMPMMAGMEMSSMNEMSDRAMSDMPMSEHVKHAVGAEHAVADNSGNSTPYDTMSPLEMMDAACGYCVLLMHLPLLVLLAIPLLWSLARMVRPPFIRVTSCLIPAPVFTDAQPRAPPELVWA
ncbi:DUF2946 domain-containing protein [Rouxiella badensis]|jgi:hypothetical protein|uniref:DUF2946 domain-containing protein n=1 Tax=Rouxiella badensis TaxID=1646377 RepID=A0A1X0WCM0_9GAMM|nr:DUF2946 domain-containing protein [Rouxiella badensis]ORJ24475.1 hypothetical protein BS640_15910 [Rouxiella badensis]QOI55911.1 DUF2946 domain-containing protein [Rouxiella badensis subsp. acadiensis]WAT06521.1 DUF2946 domain-containing protein [Rouxiella badensis]